MPRDVQTNFNCIVINNIKSKIWATLEADTSVGDNRFDFSIITLGGGYGVGDSWWVIS